MNCHECALEVEEDRIFCPGCWAPLSESKVAKTKGVKEQKPLGSKSSGVSARGNPGGKARRRRDMGILIVDMTFLLAMLGYAFSVAITPINTPSNPLTADRLFTAYALDQATADKQYSGKVAYIKGTNSIFGVGRDSSSGQYYSSLECQCAWLYWQNPSDATQLAVRQTFLAKCTVGGLEQPTGLGIVVSFHDCALVPPVR